MGIFEIMLLAMLSILLIALLGMVITLLVHMWVGVILPEIDKRKEHINNDKNDM